MKRPITFTLLSIFSFFYCYAQQDTLLSDQYLKDHIQRIRSIDASDTNYDDLTFLSKELEGVEIVLLGEQGHGDGASFLAKTRLIKYLHEKLDFNVLSFESGLKDANRVWEAIKAGNHKTEVFDLGVFPIWSQSNQVVPLMEYIIEQSKTDNPLIFSGFDMQPTGIKINPDMRVSELMTYLNDSIAGFKEDRFPMFTSVFSDLAGASRKKPTVDKEQVLVKELHGVQDLILSVDQSLSGKTMFRYIDNLYKTLALFWKANLQDPSSTPHIFNSRDREMARNMSYLKDVLYPGQKIIVWAANTHIGYNRAFLEPYEGNDPPDRGMIPMGSYLKTDLQDKVYTVSFTSAQGKVGRMSEETVTLSPAKEDSFEARLSDLGYDLGFLSFRPLRTENLKFVSRIYGHSEMMASWARMTDAVFFIKTMQESVKR